MGSDKSKDDYELDLKQYSNHRKVFPWMFIVKIIIGASMIGLIYYMTKAVIERQTPKEVNTEIEIDAD